VSVFFEALFKGSGTLATYVPDVGAPFTSEELDLYGNGPAPVNGSNVGDVPNLSSIAINSGSAKAIYADMIGKVVALKLGTPSPSKNYFVEIEFDANPYETVQFDMSILMRASLITGSPPYVGAFNGVGAEFYIAGNDVGEIVMYDFQMAPPDLLKNDNFLDIEQTEARHTYLLRVECRDDLLTILLNGDEIVSEAIDANPLLNGAGDTYVIIEYADTGVDGIYCDVPISRVTASTFADAPIVNPNPASPTEQRAKLFLFDSLPLRTTRQLGDFAEDNPLAHVYGDLTAARFPLRRISATRGHAADHSMQITGAGSGTTPTLSYAAVIEPDDTGRMCTWVDFAAPVPVDDVMWAFGRGKLNAATGAIIANPGDILADISNAIAGRSDSYQTAREECAAAGILLAGRVAVAQSIRTTLDAPAQSAGLIWCPGMSRRYPAPVSGYVLELDRQRASLRGDPTATVDDTADILRLRYDWCDVTDKPQRSIDLAASPRRFGGVVKELSLPWLRTPANAVTVGTPILQRLACERYAVPLSVSRTDIRPGQWLRLADLPDWPFTGTDPVVMALSVVVDRAIGSSEIDAEWMRTTPAVSVSAHSAALDDLSGASIEVTARSGTATIVARDENERPIAGARVSLDGGDAKTTDDRGRATFAYETTLDATGRKVLHEVVIEAPGHATQKLFIPL